MSEYAKREAINRLQTSVSALETLTASMSTAELGFVDGVTAGTGLASKALVLNSSGNVVMPSAGIFGLSRGTLAAAGSGASDAAVITQQVTAVTGSNGTLAVALPAAATTIGPFLVINTVDTEGAFLPVFPVNGGNDNINGLAEDAAFTMDPGESAWFIPISATQWYVERINVRTLGKVSVLGQLKLSDGANPVNYAALQTAPQSADLDVIVPDPGALTTAYVALSTAALTAAEVDVLDTALAGTVVNSKAVIYDTAGKVYHSSASPAAAGSTVADATAITAQYNYVTGANGTVGVVLPVAAADEEVTIVNSVTTAGNYLKVYAITGSQINALGSTVAFQLNPGQTATFIGRSATLWNTAAASDTISGLTASAAELNILDNATVVVAEINSLTNQPASLTTVSTTPASGTCAVQLALKDSAGAALNHAVSGIGYSSTVDGLDVAAVTSFATLTNGIIDPVTTTKVFHFITSATGTLGCTVTAGAGTYYLTLQLPNGKLVTSSAIVVNA